MTCISCFHPVPSTGETAAHRTLKTLCLHWARAEGYRVAAPEVRVPRSGFRADVAASWVRSGEFTRTVLFECKQARSDFLRDAAPEAAGQVQLAALLARRSALEALLGQHRPDLRRGDELFPEFAAFDFDGLEHKTYRRLNASIRTWQMRMQHGTKFARLHRYQAADLLYLVTPPDLAAPAEVPAGWGWLVAEKRGLVLARPPERLQPTALQRQALGLTIALAATNAVWREHACPPPESPPR